MNSSHSSVLPGATRGRFFRGVSLLVAAGALSVASLLAQDAAAGAENPNGRAGRRGQNGAGREGGGRGNFDPQQMQQQQMERLREQFGVTDDAEWKLIETRLTAITELRRANLAGAFGGLGGGRGAGGGPGGGGGRAGRGGGSPEQEALRSAIADKLPDAEIKSRLERLREVRKANEEKLTKAQEDLRAVLSVRQEAVAVMFGLLP